MKYQCMRCGKQANEKLVEMCHPTMEHFPLGHDWMEIQTLPKLVLNDEYECVNCHKTARFMETAECPMAKGTSKTHVWQWKQRKLDAVCTMEQAHEVLAITDSAWHKQVGGDHYHEGGISPFEYSMANGHNCLEFSIVKYLRKKGDKAQRLEDLRKLIDCAQKLLEWEEKDGKI